MEMVEMDTFGVSRHYNIKNCDKTKISNAPFITQAFNDLIKFIDMEAFGEPLLVRFGKEKRVEGFTYVQLIQTSAITAHFVDDTGAAYIDIFSCKDFDGTAAGEFLVARFGGSGEYYEIERE
jgi:S-adenosylmethionine/arginine decarboxylase-like enzyme